MHDERVRVCIRSKTVIGARKFSYVEIIVFILYISLSHSIVLRILDYSLSVITRNERAAKIYTLLHYISIQRLYILFTINRIPSL